MMVFGVPSLPSNPPQLPEIPGIPEVNTSRPENLVEHFQSHVRNNLTLENLGLSVLAQEGLQFIVNNSNNTYLQNLDLTVWNNEAARLMLNINDSLPEGVNLPRNVIGDVLHFRTNVTQTVLTELNLELNQSSQTLDYLSSPYVMSYWNSTRWVDLYTETSPNGTITVRPELTPFDETLLILRNKLASRTTLRAVQALRSDSNMVMVSLGVNPDIVAKINQGQDYLLSRGLTPLFLRSSETLDLSFMNTTHENIGKLLTLKIDPDTTMRLKINSSEVAPSGVLEPQRGIGYFLDIDANETFHQAQLGSYLNQTQLMELFGPQVNVSRLTWAFWNGLEWEPVMSRITEEGYLLANTTHFSTWTIIETQAPEISDSDEPVETDETDDPVDPLVPDIADDTDNREPANLVPIPPMFTFIGLVAVIMALVYTRRA